MLANRMRMASGKKKGIVSALLHFNELYATPSLTDSVGKIWSNTNTGYVYPDTTNKKFGAASMSFNGAGQVEHPAHEDFNFGSENFTIELFWRRTNNTTAGFADHIIGQDNTNQSGDNGKLFSTVFLINMRDTKKFKVYIFCGLTGYIIDGTTATTLNAWCHVAVVRTGDVVKLYVNGIEEGNVSIGDNAINSSINQYQIGGGGGGASYGNIDEVIVIKGEALYYSNFTPRTTEFTLV